MNFLTERFTQHNPIQSIQKKDILLIILCSSILSVLALVTKSFWGDEILSLNFSSQPLHGLLSQLAQDYHPPLYFLLLKGWLWGFGSSEVSLRIFQGVLAGVLFLVSLVFFRKYFPVYRYHPLWLLFLLSGEVWLFAPMLRYYSFAASIVLLTSLLFLEWIAAPTKKQTLLLSLLYAITLYTDYPSSVIIAVQGIYVLFKKRELLKRYFFIVATALVLFIPWVIVTLQQIHTLIKSQQIADFNASPLAIPLKVAYTFYAFVLGETIYPYESIAVIALVILSAVAILSRKSIKQIFSSTVGLYAALMICCGVLFTALITTFISRHTSFIYTPSRAFFALPFLFIAGACVYKQCARNSLKWIFIGTMLLANIYSITNWALNRHFLMPVYATPWKEVLTDLEGKDGSIVADEQLCYDYYRHHRQGIYPNAVNISSLQEFRQLLDATDTLYVLLTGRESSHAEIPEEILEALTSNYHPIWEKKYLLLDESYRQFKSRLLKRESYDAKLTLMMLVKKPQK